MVVVRLGVCIGEPDGDGKGLSDCVKLALGLCDSVQIGGDIILLSAEV